MKMYDNRLFLLAFLLLILSSCQRLNIAPSLKLYALNCGNITIQDASQLGAVYSEGDILDLPVLCYLVQHPQGMLLWDTGISPSFIQKYNLAAVPPEPPLTDQLKAISVGIQDIDFLALSHMHYDHAGNANLFAHATWLVQEPEYEVAFSAEASKYAFFSELYQSLDTAVTIQLNGDYDVFQDGTVVIKAAYGHTPGHQTLFINLANFGPILLSGDLYHTAVTRDAMITSYTRHPRQSLETARRMERFLQETNTQLWIGHDSQQYQQYPHSPDFLD